MSTQPHDDAIDPDTIDPAGVEADLLADPHAAGDPDPLDGRDGQPVRGSSDDPQDWAVDGRPRDDLRAAESEAMHVVGPDEL